MNRDERIKLEQNDWFLGVVNFFDSREGKRFGFLAGESLSWETQKKDPRGFIEIRGGPGWKQNIFFHFNNGHPVVAGSKDIIIRLRKTVFRDPRIGDNILFKVIEGAKGPKAVPWCYLEEYERAKKSLAAGKGSACFDNDNFDYGEFEHGIGRFQAAAGWVPPQYDGMMLRHIEKSSHVTF